MLKRSLKLLHKKHLVTQPTLTLGSNKIIVKTNSASSPVTQPIRTCPRDLKAVCSIRNPRRKFRLADVATRKYD
jgi:hypothetical protein